MTQHHGIKSGAHLTRGHDQRQTPLRLVPLPKPRHLGDKLQMLAMATNGPKYMAAIETLVDFLLTNIKPA